jgi:hypothetical protein
MISSKAFHTQFNSVPHRGRYDILQEKLESVLLVSLNQLPMQASLPGDISLHGQIYYGCSMRSTVYRPNHVTNMNTAPHAQN